MASEPQEPPILLSVDLQNGMVEGDPSWGPRSTPNLVENVKYLLKTWREKGWPIIHIQHDAKDEPDNPIAARFPKTFAIHTSAAPEGEEKVFVKHTSSAFLAPGVLDAIKSYGKRKIVVIGMDGAQCVNSTTRSGDDNGYKMVIVADACSSYGYEDYEGKQLPAQDTHDSAMYMLMAFGKVTMTKDLLKVLGYE
jgi:nicotinamidase-related amidase